MFLLGRTRQQKATLQCLLHSYRSACLPPTSTRLLGRRVLKTAELERCRAEMAKGHVACRNNTPIIKNRYKNPRFYIYEEYGLKHVFYPQEQKQACEGLQEGRFALV